MRKNVNQTSSKSPNQQVEQELIKAARRAVLAAIDSDYKSNPLFSPEISRLVSTHSSVVVRHGPLIERAIGDCLAHAGLSVSRNRTLPITREALAIVESSDYRRHADLEFEFNSDAVVGSVDVDVLAIDKRNGWAAAMSVKRGGGTTASRMRRTVERDLRALRLTLTSYLRQHGHNKLLSSEVVLIDYLGQAGFSEELTLARDEIDEFFLLPVTATIDAMTAAMKGVLDAKLPSLLSPVLDGLKRSMEPTRREATDLQINRIERRPRGRFLGHVASKAVTEPDFLDLPDMHLVRGGA